MNKEQLREEFLQGYSPVVRYGGIKDITTLEEISNYWLEKIDLALKEQRDSMVENHYCCKNQTVRKEDFCDECLNLVKQYNRN